VDATNWHFWCSSFRNRALTPFCDDLPALFGIETRQGFVAKRLADLHIDSFSTKPPACEEATLECEKHLPHLTRSHKATPTQPLKIDQSY
jgi:hypothetical protein